MTFLNIISKLVNGQPAKYLRMQASKLGLLGPFSLIKLESLRTPNQLCFCRTVFHDGGVPTVYQNVKRDEFYLGGISTDFSSFVKGSLNNFNLAGIPPDNSTAVDDFCNKQ